MHFSTRLTAHAIAAAFGVFLIAPHAGATDSVDLRFAWPNDLAGTATFTTTHSSQNGDEPATAWEVRGSTRLVVSPSAGSLVVDFEDAEFALTRNTATGLSRQLGVAFVPIIMSMPDYRVGRDGGFIGLEHPAAFLRAVESAVKPAIVDLPEEHLESVAPIVAQAMSEVEFERRTGVRWRDEVGRWIGRTVESGKPTSEEDSVYMEVTGAGQVPARTTYRLLGRAPCGDSAGNDCVELEFRTIAEGPAAIVAYARIQRSRGSTTEVRGFRFEATTRLISDPRTLVPYQRRTEWNSIIGLESYPEDISIRQTGESTVTYAYD